jgi:hypothetical protein
MSILRVGVGVGVGVSGVCINMSKSVCYVNGSSVGTSMSKIMNLREKMSKSKGSSSSE